MPLDGLEEIRIRIHQPLVIRCGSKEYFIKEDGEAVPESCRNAYKPMEEDLNRTLELMSNYSLYAFEEEIKNGYITIRGGHRVGICGQAVLAEGAVKTIKNVNGLNIRMTHQVKGCAGRVIERIARPALKHTMIISPPGCGKTTLIRDIARLLSNGDAGKGIPGYNIGIVDERSEIAGCYQGVPQNDVGVRTDILDAAPKAKGMVMLLRSMSPQAIIVDEIGRKEDSDAIDEIVNSGVKVICTVHGASVADILKKAVLSEILQKDIFELFIVLKYGQSAGEIAGIYEKKDVAERAVAL
jgi:stage III sporulation protein AA